MLSNFNHAPTKIHSGTLSHKHIHINVAIYFSFDNCIFQMFFPNVSLPFLCAILTKLDECAFLRIHFNMTQSNLRDIVFSKMTSAFS